MAGEKSLTDEELVHATLHGEQDAFGVLLERHFPVLRAVALAYAHAKDDAEDLVQEASVKAYRSLDTLRDRSRFLPWLTKSLIRLAHDVRRKESRRSTLADRVAQNPGYAEPTSERDEMRAIVRRELARLDDDQRVVLLLRYYGGQEVRTIADTLGIRPHAAAKRLQRAREALGERLLEFVAEPEAEEHGRKRISSIMSAVALTQPPWMRGGSATVAAGTGASAALRAFLVAVTGVAAVCIPLTILWLNRLPDKAHEFGGDAQLPIAEPASAPASDAGPIPESNPTDSGASAETDTARVGADESGATLTVHVHDRDTGRGISSAEVRVAPETRLEGLSRTSIHTDSSGYATLGALPVGTFRVELTSAPGYFVKSHREREQISVEGPADDISVEFVLSKGLAVRAVVVDEGGRPIPDARVSGHVERTSIQSNATTGYDGSVVLLGLAETEHFVVQPVKDGYALGPQGPLTIPASGLDGLVLTMYPAATVSGTLVDQNGDTLPGYNISMSPVQQFSSRIAGIKRDRVNPDGSFTVRGLWPGSFSLMIGEPGTGGYRTIPGVDPVEIGAGEHVIGLVVVYETEPISHIAGRVVDSQGAPVRRAEVTADYNWGTHRHFTDDAGRFRIDRLAEGNYSLYVWHDRYTARDLKEVHTGRDDVEVVLQLRGAVEGRVVDRITGDPIPEFTVLDPGRLRPGTIDDVAVRFGNADGRFHLANVQAGTRTVSVSAPGYESASLDGISVRSGRTTSGLNFELLPSATAEGVVVSQAGVTVPDAYVFTKDEEPTFTGAAATADSAHPAGQRFYQLTGKDGRFRVDSISSDAPYVVAYHRIHGFAFRRIDTKHEEIQALRLQLRPPGIIEGFVQRNGEPIAAVEVEASGPRSARDFTDESGYYRLPVPDDNEVSIGVSVSPSSIRVRDVSVTSGETVGVDFDFTPANTHVSGWVTFDGRPPDEDLQVRITAAQVLAQNREVHVSVNCDTRGYYQLIGAPPGDVCFQIAVSRNFENGVWFPEGYAVIEEGVEHLLDFELDASNLPKTEE